MEYTIRRLGVGSVFKLSFIIYALLGLFMMFFYVLMLLMLAQMGSALDYPEWQPMVSAIQGFGAVAAFIGGLFFALVYAVVSAAVTSAMACVYNLLAGWIGGLRLEMEVEPTWGQGVYQGTGGYPGGVPPSPRHGQGHHPGPSRAAHGVYPPDPPAPPAAPPPGGPQGAQPPPRDVPPPDTSH